MNLARGTSIKGLIGMAQGTSSLGRGALWRPLINISKKALLDYAKSCNLRWIEDESNFDTQFTRNFIRHEILSKFQTKWPKAAANLTALSKNASDTQELLKELAEIDCPNIWQKLRQLPLTSLYSLSKKRIINVIQVWLEKHNVPIRNSKILQRIIDEIIFARKDAEPIVAWDEFQIRRYRDNLYLLSNTPKSIFPDIEWQHFPEPFKYFSGEMLSLNDFEMLDEPQDTVTITYRMPNAKVKYRGYTKQMSKLYQEWGIAPWNRKTCLLLVGQSNKIIGFLKEQ
jgi:tRNA(Ile)-lysidine synthase